MTNIYQCPMCKMISKTGDCIFCKSDKTNPGGYINKTIKVTEVI